MIIRVAVSYERTRLVANNALAACIPAVPFAVYVVENRVTTTADRRVAVMVIFPQLMREASVVKLSRLSTPS